MKRVLLMVIIAAAGCNGSSSSATDAGTDTTSDTDSDTDSDTWPEYEATGVDILFVIDNSGSMQEEQEILATAMFPLANAMTNPLPTWPFAPLDSVRLAAVSTDMGLQWGGNPYENGDGWPEYAPQGCGSVGDNGEFQTYSSGKTIDIQNDVIPCDASAAQCPTGWTCSAAEVDDIGTCLAPGGDGDNQTCPGLAAIWSENPIGPPDDQEPNEEFAFHVACLSALGTNGCSWEQQLQASTVALHKTTQDDFLRDDSLLAVVIVTNSMDCSMESNELFAVPEIQNLEDGKLNLACGTYPEFLYSVEHYHETYLGLKGGNPNGVIFAAIAGVPVDDACQGAGDQIVECLDHPDMQLEEIEISGNWFFSPGCVRYEGDTPVTNGWPGYRFVNLALLFGENGYVYSLCNESYIPAMNDIAQMIADELND
jgi:hypothetical protein